MLIMKKFILFLLFLIPLLGVSQTAGQSWFEIEMEFGQYTFNDQTILITKTMIRYIMKSMGMVIITQQDIVMLLLTLIQVI